MAQTDIKVDPSTLTYDSSVPPELPPYTINTVTPSSSYRIPSHEKISCFMTGQIREYGPNTANPYIPSSMELNISMAEYVLDLSRIPAGTDIRVHVYIRFAGAAIIIPEGVLVKNDINVSMGDCTDKRTNFKLDSNHSTITLSGTVSLGELEILDDPQASKSYAKMKNMKK
ncbi:hypothetical protein HK098_005778 [Nowakowskiella sp. JEL0407]|nr:hypothetical protein HK098_005778 [Nowakowskiella sp. JEL0407]